jgi:hypothetical protein
VKNPLKGILVDESKIVNEQELGQAIGKSVVENAWAKIQPELDRLGADGVNISGIIAGVAVNIILQRR